MELVSSRSRQRKPAATLFVTAGEELILLGSYEFFCKNGVMIECARE